ncbi:MAG TPA: alpha/beta hydrolase [Microscillaceae bacterium]|nr:alpha/beta hydrolase [Microscillaceae bacterium]
MKNQDWIQPTLYPFKRHYVQLSQGTMHYLDEGQGETIVFIHGTPTWSFLYRDFIKSLSTQYRCIAIDHLGFGLSDKPKGFAGTPQAHSQNLQEFIDLLGLENITLVVHDFGGPIGLSWAIAHPQKVKRLVLFNTWLWETQTDKDAQKIDKLLHGWLGNYLYLNTNFSPKVLLKQAFFDKKKLSKPVHKHYLKPFPNKASRYGLLKIGQSLVGSSDWYQQQFEQIDQIKNKPALILWGMQDKFIRPTYLQKWGKTLPQAKIRQLESGHFVQEEAPQVSIAAIKEFMLENTPALL